MKAFNFDIAVPPISFEIGGKKFSDVIGSWARQESQSPSAGGHTQTITYASPADSLELILTVRYLNSVNGVEWVCEFKNTGQTNTPIIENIQALDYSWTLDDKEKTFIHHAHGSECVIDDFVPRVDEVWPSIELTLSPNHGRSSDGEMPFMNVVGSDGGVAFAIGWSGQWKANFARKDGKLTIQAGMDKTRLYLKPGEHIRTPRILMLSYSGNDCVVGNNLLRKALLDFYCPRDNGELILPPIAHMTMSSYHVTQIISQEVEMEALAKAASLGCEAYWVDACWYGSGKSWWEEVGNWNIRREIFPDGLKPIGDAAHAAGMKFVLWFEPERVRQKAAIATEHPEYLLQSTNDPDNALLNLGMPEALKYITDAVDAIVTESGVDIYRQDFNFGPLSYWDQADEADRIGMTQIKYIEGLYAMWDELLRRHPGMAIDNCASGGRRIDLETCTRSFPLWRSDFSDVGGPSWGPGLQVGDQCQTAGLSPWVPLHTAAVWSFSPYAFRSAMSTGVVLYCNIRVPDFPDEDAKLALKELKSLRPYYLGDFYPLIPLTAAYHDWCGYQHHRPDENDGFALLLRRHNSPYERVRVGLKGLDDDAKYMVSMSDSFIESPRKEMKGSELSDLSIAIADVPGSLLIRYQIKGK